AGVKLRPHAKTHKVLEIGRMQIAAGAAGLSLAKTSEAEVFATAGFDDIFLAYPIVGSGKARRLLALCDGVRLAVGVDSEDGARSLGEVFHAAGRRLDVLLKVDCGFHRVGVSPEGAPEMARRLAQIPGLSLRGLFTHAGHGYHAPTPEAVAAVGRSESQTLLTAAGAVREIGIPVEEISVGSTPTAPYAMSVPGVTECRPGNYVYNDASQVSLGTCAIEDCAMTVLATVVSVPARERAVLDAGSKTLSSDALRPQAGGHGFLLGYRSRIERLSEEHGVVAVAAGESFRVAERVRVLPNHACVVANLHDRIFGVRNGRVETEFRVAARGRVE
ncbi:MAG TPA: alanine racemase, partial [Thermoanaerobaculia bacterium]|nr:alanine racemase [Thermoanaerobaculia bacterium]